jgi:hypothetical protein
MRWIKNLLHKSLVSSVVIDAEFSMIHHGPIPTTAIKRWLKSFDVITDSWARLSSTLGPDTGSGKKKNLLGMHGVFFF